MKNFKSYKTLNFAFTCLNDFMKLNVRYSPVNTSFPKVKLFITKTDEDRRKPTATITSKTVSSILPENDNWTK